MPLILTSGPSAEPVSLAEVKAHCRVDGDAEDTLLASLALAARMHVERALGVALIAQGWSLFLDRWPDRAWVDLPLAPVIGVDAVRLHRADDSFTTADAGLFQLDGAGARPRLARRDGGVWPLPGRAVNGVEIAFTAGYGPTADDVPMPVRLAIKMLAAHWFEMREPVVIGGGDSATPVPMSVAGLLSPYRTVRL